jgi:hypothetical protein
MERRRDSSHPLQSDSKRKIRVRTTMLDLISALNNEIKAGEEILVPFIMLDMMQKGVLKFVGPPKGKTARAGRKG